MNKTLGHVRGWHLWKYLDLNIKMMRHGIFLNFEIKESYISGTLWKSHMVLSVFLVFLTWRLLKPGLLETESHWLSIICNFFLFNKAELQTILFTQTIVYSINVLYMCL